ncbi:MAG: PAC2 family protein [Chloroflexi bacterium]|nr:PAC2 family protein [Chloroflexota bacterium]MDA1002371.1 PAC2 family protein [Chloroflexota bacterium]
MSDLVFNERPELRRPIVIAAFSGWSDAGEAATGAVRFMTRRWRTKPFAEIDAENFYDFTQTRPRVRLERGERVIDWPANHFFARRREGSDRDLILLSGTEPHLSWRTYVECVLELCREYDVSSFITLGALLAEVSHARDVRVTGSAQEEAFGRELGLDQQVGRYQGPTGISGVLGQAIRDAGIPSASFWANIPFYVRRSPNPKGSLAVLERLNGALSLDLTLHDLEVFAARFDAQVASDIAQNPEIAEYARRIESQLPDDDDEDPEPVRPQEELPDAQTMVDELERYLREQRGPESNG